MAGVMGANIFSVQNVSEKLTVSSIRKADTIGAFTGLR